MYLIRQERNDWNHLGLEIRDVLNQQILEKIKKNPQEYHKRNLHYLTCNFAASAEDVFKSFQKYGNNVRLVSFQVSNIMYIASEITIITLLFSFLIHGEEKNN